MLYNTQFSIRLTPHGIVKPVISYGFDQTLISTITLDETITLDFNLDLPAGPKTFYLEFSNKTNETPDMAVEITDVTFEGITVDRFKWAGMYYPNYPQPWASSQTDLPKCRPTMTYLGWNGRWELTFEAPIFTWIHRLEGLGWIYD